MFYLKTCSRVEPSSASSMTNVEAGIEIEPEEAMYIVRE